MTWQEKRVVTILSTILLILSAALLIVLGIRYRENRVDPETGETPLTVSVPEKTSFYTGLTYTNGTTTLSFSLDENENWIWSDDPTFPLNDSTVLSVTDSLSNWNPQQTITDSAILADCGLAQPTASITATTTKGLIILEFGKATTDGTSYYVRLNGDESTAYIVDGALYDLLSVPIYDMYDMPEMPTLDETTIKSFSIFGASAEHGTPGILTAISAQPIDGSATPSWRSEGANVSDDPTVQALLGDLRTMEFVKCFDYRPSDEAVTICGLDKPAAHLMVHYVPEGSSEEQTLLLAIGNPLSDGSGRYAQLGEDSTIFLLPTAALDPLMRVSVSGLES